MIVRNAILFDTRFIYECRFALVSVKNSFTQTIPTFEQHAEWFKGIIGNKDIEYLVGTIGYLRVGFVRFAVTEKGTEVSICIHPDFRGNKYATELLSEAIKTRNDADKMYAEIKPNNPASFKTFAGVGV